MIESIAAVAGTPDKAMYSNQLQGPANSGQFSQWVSQGLEGVNQQLLTSQTDLQALATGDVQNLHQLMIRLEESRIAFQLMMQVRTRLLDAYQDVMRMQV